MSDKAAFTVRLTRDAHKVWMDTMSALGISGGAGARMVIEIFNERLRANGGDYIEALHTYRDALRSIEAPVVVDSSDSENRLQPEQNQSAIRATEEDAK